MYPCRKIHRNWIFTAQSTIIPSPQRSRRELEKMLATGRTITHAESTKLLKELPYYLAREHEPLKYEAVQYPRMRNRARQIHAERSLLARAALWSRMF